MRFYTVSNYYNRYTDRNHDGINDRYEMPFHKYSGGGTYINPFNNRSKMHSFPELFRRFQRSIFGHHYGHEHFGGPRGPRGPRGPIVRPIGPEPVHGGPRTMPGGSIFRR